MANSIDFETAVAESLQLAKFNSRNYIRLGEIAATVKTQYGAKTLNELAKRSGIPYTSFKCYVAVYQAFESDPVLLASSSFGVLQSLATHPDRVSIVSAQPDMPRAEARKLMSDYKRSVTVPLSPTQKLGAAFSRVNRALNPLLKMSAAMTSSSDAAVAIDQLVNARDKLQTVLGGDVAEFVLPDPDAADFANLVDPVDPDLANLVEPVVAVPVVTVPSMPITPGAAKWAKWAQICDPSRYLPDPDAGPEWRGLNGASIEFCKQHGWGPDSDMIGFLLEHPAPDPIPEPVARPRDELIGNTGKTRRQLLWAGWSKTKIESEILRAEMLAIWAGRAAERADKKTLETV